VHFNGKFSKFEEMKCFNVNEQLQPDNYSSIIEKFEKYNLYLEQTNADENNKRKNRK